MVEPPPYLHESDRRRVRRVSDQPVGRSLLDHLALAVLGFNLVGDAVVAALGRRQEIVP